MKTQISKKVLLISMTAIVLIIVSLLIFSIQKEKKFIANAKTALTEISVITSWTEPLIAFDIRIWRGAIFKEDLYWYKEQYPEYSGDFYLKEFNGAIVEALRLNKKEIGKIMKCQSRIEKMIKDLDSPPTKYKDLKKSIIVLYGYAIDYSNFAISPSGSYQSYLEATNDLNSKIKTQAREIRVQLPE